MTPRSARSAEYRMDLVQRPVGPSTNTTQDALPVKLNTNHSLARSLTPSMCSSRNSYRFVDSTQRPDNGEQWCIPELPGGPGRPGRPSSPDIPGRPRSPFLPGEPGTPGEPGRPFIPDKPTENTQHLNSVG